MTRGTVVSLVADGPRIELVDLVRPLPVDSTFMLMMQFASGAMLRVDVRADELCSAPDGQPLVTI